jgi:hypothetical protein
MQVSLFRLTRISVIHFFFPDVLIAIVVAWWLNGGLFVLAASLIGLKIIYLTIWLKDALWTWLVFSLHGRKIMADGIFATLKKNDFPKPAIMPDGFVDPGEYLSSVALDDGSPCELRLSAQMENSTLNTIKMMNGFVATWSALAAWDDALKRYNSTFTGAAI